MDFETIKKMVAEVVEFFKQVLAEIEKIFGISLDKEEAEETTTL